MPHTGHNSRRQVLGPNTPKIPGRELLHSLVTSDKSSEGVVLTDQQNGKCSSVDYNANSWRYSPSSKPLAVCTYPLGFFYGCTRISTQNELNQFPHFLCTEFLSR